MQEQGYQLLSVVLSGSTQHTPAHACLNLPGRVSAMQGASVKSAIVAQLYILLQLLPFRQDSACLCRHMLALACELQHMYTEMPTWWVAMLMSRTLSMSCKLTRPSSLNARPFGDSAEPTHRNFSPAHTEREPQTLSWAFHCLSRGISIEGNIKHFKILGCHH